MFAHKLWDSNFQSHPLHPPTYGYPPQGTLHKNLEHNPDELSPGPSSLEKYIENLFQTV
jgi:hypothetical protein